MDYIPQGSEKVLDIIKGRNIFVYGDPDMDGIGATYLVIDMLREHKVPYTYYINNDREHGLKLTDADLSKLVGCAIIAVDFHMTVEEMQHIVNMGISIVNIDHHAVEYPFAYYNNEQNGCAGVIICNQYADEPEEWRFLSGAGMVYAVFAHIFAVEQYENQARAAIVGITLLSDGCAIENDNAQYFLHAVYTWDSLESKRLINAVQTEKQRHNIFGVQRVLDREFLDFTFIPVFNALCRFNKNYEALAVLLGEYDFARYGEITCYKTKQVTMREYLLDNCMLKQTDGFLICAIDSSRLKATETSYANFIGLVANYLMNTHHCSVLIYVADGAKYVRGSFRGICSSVDYLSIFKACGVKCDGHSGAFGVLDFINDADLRKCVVYVHDAEKQAKYKGESTHKYIDVYNLQQTLIVDTKTQIYNQYVRDKFRVYYRYKGSNWQLTKESERAQYAEYTIDGVIVKTFDKDLTPQNSVIRPMKSNGYSVLTLCSACNY